MPGRPRSLDRLERVCGSTDDARELRSRLVEELRRAVGFDWYAFVLTDPRTSVGVAPLAAVPSLAELPRLIRLKYLTALNRWTSLGDPPATRLHAVTGGEMGRSLVWREMQAGYGVRDVLSAVFRDRYGCWGFLDLWRGTGEYTAADEAYVADAAGVITPALRRGQAATFASLADADGPAAGSTGAGSAGAGSPAGAAGVGPLVLLLSEELAVLGQTPLTHEYLTALVPPGPGQATVPASAYNVAAQLLAVEAGVDANPPAARVCLPDGRWLTVHAARLADRPGGTVAVTIEPTTAADRLDLFTRAHALSVREAELLGHLATGMDTRELARLMHLSEHTVQDYLKSIFAKTGTRSRRALLSRAAG